MMAKTVGPRRGYLPDGVQCVLLLPPLLDNSEAECIESFPLVQTKKILSGDINKNGRGM